MSRLFENLGDGADEAEFPRGSPPGGEAEGIEPADASAEYGLGEEERAGILTGNGPREEITVPTGAGIPSTYDVPDFEKDSADLETYEDAKRRYQRQRLASADTAIQMSFVQKREQLRREIKHGKSFEDERRTSALHTTRQYAKAYPSRVDKKGVSPPSFFENLISFGRAGRLYCAAFAAAEALAQLRQVMRKREEQLSELDDEMKRAIVLKEEAIQKALESESGLNEFHERPEIKPLFQRFEKIKRERADYAQRLERGSVSAEERRYRAMSQQKLVPAEPPITGAIIGKVARFGALSYFQLRDLEKNESLLSYDPRLDPLRNCVFDVYSVAGTVAAKLKRNYNGTAFRVADHFKACWRNADEAEKRYVQHRAALREDRGLAPMEPRNAIESEIIERLADLSAIVDGGQTQGRGYPLSHQESAPAPSP